MGARWILSAALLAGVTAAGALAQPAEAPEAKPRRVNPALRDIPQNTWVRVLAARQGPWKRNYSGMCFDSKAGRVLYWGGGHFSYPGNEVQAYRVGENRWVSLNERFVPPLPVRWLGGDTPGPDPHGRPFAPHTYDDLVFDPVGNQMLWMACRGVSGVWAFDLQRRRWRHTQPAKRPSGGLAACAAYIPHGRLAAVASPSDDYLWLYDIAAGKFTRKSKLPQRPYNAGMTYDTHSRLVVMAGGTLKDAWMYSIERDRWRKADPTDAPTGVHSPGVTFDSVHNLVLMAGATRKAGTRQWTNRTWLLDAATGKWRDPRPKALPTFPLVGVYGSLTFDPVHNVAILAWAAQWRGKCETWVYRCQSPKRGVSPEVSR
jgi:hypothetical protein